MLNIHDQMIVWNFEIAFHRFHGKFHWIKSNVIDLIKSNEPILSVTLD